MANGDTRNPYGAHDSYNPGDAGWDYGRQYGLSMDTMVDIGDRFSGLGPGESLLAMGRRQAEHLRTGQSRDYLGLDGANKAAVNAYLEYLKRTNPEEAQRLAAIMTPDLSVLSENQQNIYDEVTGYGADRYNSAYDAQQAAMKSLEGLTRGEGLYSDAQGQMAQTDMSNRIRAQMAASPYSAGQQLAGYRAMGDASLALGREYGAQRLKEINDARQTYNLAAQGLAESALADRKNQQSAMAELHRIFAEQNRGGE